MVAAVCTTLSNLPQLKKCWETGSAGDLSLRMLLLHSTGVALWIGYGVVRGDWVIIISNSISLLLLLGILFFKLREKPGKPRRPPYLAPPRHGVVAKASEVAA